MYKMWSPEILQGQFVSLSHFFTDGVQQKDYKACDDECHRSHANQEFQSVHYCIRLLTCSCVIACKSTAWTRQDLPTKQIRERHQD